MIPAMTVTVSIDGGPTIRLAYDPYSGPAAAVTASARAVYELVVEAMDPAWVAAERGVSQAVLTEQLRNAVQWVASAYEARAYAGEVAELGLAGTVRARMAGKRG